MHKPIFSRLTIAFASSLILLGINASRAATVYWSGDGVVQGGGGAWDVSSTQWGFASSGPYISLWNNAGDEVAVFGGAPGNVSVGAGITNGGLQFESAFILTNNSLTFGVESSIACLSNATVSSVLLGTSGITKSGGGTLTLRGSSVNLLTGGLVLKGGSLLTDFTNLVSATDLINSNNSLTLAGGGLTVKGRNSGTSSQTFSGVTVNAGGGQILGDKNGGTSTTIKLGSLTTTDSGGSLILGAGGTSGNSPIITTTSNKDSSGTYGGRAVFFSGTANTGYDWASTASGSSPYTISAYNSYTPLPTSGGSSTVNYRLTNNITLASGFSVKSLKFAPGATNNQALDLGVDTLTIDSGGLLITGTGNATTISNGTLTAGAGGNYDLIVHQFNSAGGIANGQNANSTAISAVIADNGGNAVALVKSGTGTLALLGTNIYTGHTYVNAGNLLLGSGGSVGTLGGGNYSSNIYVAANANFCAYFTSPTTQTLGGVISGEGSLIKSFSGTLTLSTNNTYSGKTWLNAITTSGGGTLNVASFNSVNGGNPPMARSSLGRPITVASGTIDFGGSAQGGGTLRYTGPGETTDRTIHFIANGSGAGKTIDASGTGLLRFTSTFLKSGAGSSGTSSGNDITLTGAGSGHLDGGLPALRNFTKSGAGTWSICGPGSYTGNSTISAGTLVVRNGGGLSGIGTVSVSANAGLQYYALSDAPLNIAGSFTNIGGTSTTLGASIGSGTNSATINVVGSAAATSTVKVNLYGIGVTPETGTNLYSLIQGGGGSSLNAATYSLGAIYNAVNFTVGTLSKTPDNVSVAIAQVPPLTNAYWKGTATAGLTRVWAASNGSNDGNWAASAGGSVQSLVPGPGADVTISASTPSVAPTNTTLGAEISIRSLTIADVINGLSLAGVSSNCYALTVGSGGITMNVSVPASSIGVRVVLAASQAWTNNSASPLTISGPVSGNGNFEKAGSGTLVLSGANTYTGNTAVRGGTLALNQPTFPISSTVTVNSGAVLQLNFSGTNAVTRLVLNGVTQPGGVFNSSNAGSYLTGTGSLRVLVNDTDGDGIPDAWTQQYFGHPTGQVGDLSRAQDDADSDGLTNEQEYQAGSNPRLSDTDGDSLSDGAEVAGAGLRPPTSPLLLDTDGDGVSDLAESNTGTWVGAGNTGTDPTKADTDGDALNDKIESNTGVYVSSTNTGTSPLMADTDGDGAADWYEIYASFTDPFIAASKPNIPYPLPKPDNTPAATNKPVKVFILMGQSNMVGQGNVDSENTPGTLASIVKQQGKFPNLLDTNGNWSARKDVTYKGVVAATASGPLTVGQGSGAGVIGPELGFGHIMGYHFNEPVLVLKTSEGGKDIGYQLLPPGSQRYTNSGYVYAGYGDSPKKWLVGTTPIPDATYGGEQYDKTVAAAKGVLTNFNTLYTNYAAQGYVIAGFGWFQGYNDIAGEAVYPERYETNLANYIKAIRAEFNVPTNTPFVVAGCGFDGWGASGDALTVINAQLAMTNAAKYPEFVGNVQAMETRGYWRTGAESPADQGYHYNRNAETFMLVGDAMGRGMLKLLTAGSGNDYANWATNFPGTNLSDPNADADGDARSNDYERIWGLNPTNAASSNPFTSLSGLASGNFSYTRRTPSLTGYSYTVWTSTNLVSWTQDAGAIQTPGAAVAEVETVAVTLSPALLTQPRLFVRMRAQ